MRAKRFDIGVLPHDISGLVPGFSEEADTRIMRKARVHWNKYEQQDTVEQRLRTVDFR